MLPRLIICIFLNIILFRSIHSQDIQFYGHYGSPLDFVIQNDTIFLAYNNAVIVSDINGKIIKKYQLLEGFTGLSSAFFFNDENKQLYLYCKLTNAEHFYKWTASNNFKLSKDPLFHIPKNTEIGINQNTVFKASKKNRIKFLIDKKWVPYKSKLPKNIKYYTIRNLLPDSKERLWILNYDSLYCYDGKTTYSFPEMANGQILEEKDGNIWFKSFRTLRQMEVVENELSMTNTNIAAELITVDKKGNLLGVSDKNLFYRKDGKFNFYELPATFKKTYPQSTIFHNIYIDDNNIIWILYDICKIQSFDLNSKKFGDQIIIENLFPFSDPVCESDEKGNLYVCSKLGLHKFYRGVQQSFISLDSLGIDGYNYEFSSAKDNQKNIWFSISQALIIIDNNSDITVLQNSGLEGAKIFNRPKGGLLFYEDSRISIMDSLGYVYSRIFKKSNDYFPSDTKFADSSDILWIQTRTELRSIQKDSAILHVISKNQQYRRNLLYIGLDSNYGIWAMFEGLLYSYRNEKWQEVKMKGIRKTDTYSMYPIPNGGFYVKNGNKVFKFENDSLKKIKLNPGRKTIIAADSKSNLLLENYANKFFYFSNSKIKKILKSKTYLYGYDDVKLTSNGDLWIYGNNGLIFIPSEKLK